MASIKTFDIDPYLQGHLLMTLQSDRHQAITLTCDDLHLCCHRVTICQKMNKEINRKNKINKWIIKKIVTICQRIPVLKYLWTEFRQALFWTVLHISIFDLKISCTSIHTFPMIFIDLHIKHWGLKKMVIFFQMTLSFFIFIFFYENVCRCHLWFR